MSALRRTPLYEAHRTLGARMVPFAGFEMPVQYTSIKEEHRAVRERAGLFDVSHMGQLHLRGPGALDAAERLVTCSVADLRPGRVRYGLLCNDGGGVVDDVTVYRLAEDAVFFCVNAANREKDLAWIRERAGAGVAVDDRSDATGLLAVQGPRGAEIVAALADGPLPRIGRFGFRELALAGRPVLVSRTGYTGEDGFELYLDEAATPALFEALLEAGRERGLLPAGLGARDTLRLEAALPLYGHELDDTTSPLEAGLGRFVKRDRGGFIGAEALEKRAAQGLGRRLVGFALEDRRVARAEHVLCDAAGGAIGRVTSGAPSPTLGKSIGLGYVRPASAEEGTPLFASIRDRLVEGRVVPTPFVRRGS